MTGTGQQSTRADGGASAEATVTPLELFFDLVFVFAFTQVSSFLAHNLSWTGIAQGAALLAVLWWAWVCYSWLTGAVSAEASLPARLVVLTAMVAMLFVALAVPDAFGDDALLFGVAYFVVRALHVVFYYVVAPADTRAAVRRVAPGFLGGPLLLVASSAVEGPLRPLLWLLAILVDYGVVYVRGVAGFHVDVGHFVERYRLVVIIALGESVVAIGLGAEALELVGTVLLAALLGIVLVVTLWWLYFDYVILAAERRLAAADEEERTLLARDSYSVLHLAIVGGIVFIALGVEQTLAHVGDPLGLIPAAALCGGAACYLLGHNAFRYRDHGTVSDARLLVAAAAVALIPVVTQLAAVVGLGVLTLLLVTLAVYETRFSDHRNRIRAP